MAHPVKQVTVEIFYANQQQQFQLALQLPASHTVAAAIAQSGLLEQHPELMLTKHKIGVFNKIINANERLVQDGDRIEIYQPLQVDPKQARLLRAKKMAKC